MIEVWRWRFQPALDSGDRFADSLAELGIGVNPGITTLTGSTLIDEKCAGTAHIALGDNQRYGGLHGSNVHKDLYKPAVTLTAGAISLVAVTSLSVMAHLLSPAPRHKAA